MPPDPTPKASATRKRSLTSKRGAIACVRCKERKARCVPAPPGTSNVPTCTNCFTARAECVYLERTPNELFLLEYVTQLEARIAELEIELSKYRPESAFTLDHAQTQAAAINALTKQYPPPSLPSVEEAEDGEQKVAWKNLTLTESEDEKTSEKGEEEADLARGIGMLSLSGSGEPVYVGPSSGFDWARVCATVLRRPDPQATLSRFKYFPPPEASSVDSVLSYAVEHPVPPLPPPPLAAKYMEVAYKYIQSRYGFLDWPTIRNWHDNREAICLNRPLWGVGKGEDYRRSMAAFFLWLIYGFGAILTEKENLEGAISHQVYHNIAVACLANITSHHSMATVQAELLLTIYSLLHPHPEVSVWQCQGLALRTAVQIGLHRRARTRAEREKDPLRYEIKKRTFWGVYTIDRMLALQLGRPSGIQDRDIDVEMPLNIDAEYADPKGIFAMQNQQIDDIMAGRGGNEYANGYDSLTSMTSCIHNIRLNQLKQLIQDANYRVDQPVRRQSEPSAPAFMDRSADIDGLLLRFNQWRSCHPSLPPGRSGVPLQSVALFDMEYHNAVQMLLRPILALPNPDSRYLRKCTDSAASLCEIEYSVLHPIIVPPRLTNWALYRLFLSGLTLLHLASPPCPHIDPSRADLALKKCRDSLRVYAQSLPGTAAYADCFQELVDAWSRQMSQPIPSPSYIASSSRPTPSARASSNPSCASTPSMNDPQAFAKWLESQGLAAPQHQTTPGHMNGIQETVNPISLSQSPPLTGPPGSMSVPTQSAPRDPFNISAQVDSSPIAFSHLSDRSLASAASQQQQQQQQHQRQSSQHHQHGFTPGPSGGLGLLGSPKASEAFTDQWGGKLGEMGDRLGGGMRDDFFSLLNSLGVDTNMDEAPADQNASSVFMLGQWHFMTNPTHNSSPQHVGASTGGSSSHMNGPNGPSNGGGNVNSHSHGNGNGTPMELLQHDWTAEAGDFTNSGMGLGDDEMWRFPFV